MKSTTQPIMQPLLEFIENSNEKWEVEASEYEELKSYYSMKYDASLEGYDEWFHANFKILTPEPILLDNPEQTVLLFGKEFTADQLKEALIDQAFLNDLKQKMEETV